MVWLKGSLCAMRKKPAFYGSKYYSLTDPRKLSYNYATEETEHDLL